MASSRAAPIRATAVLCCLAAATPLARAQGTARPTSIAGRVLDARGEPAAEALVYLVWRTHPDLPPGFDACLGDDAFRCEVGATDAAGQFKLDVPVPCPLMLYARRGEAEVSRLRFPVLPGDFAELQLEPAPRASGVVSIAAAKRPLAAGGVAVEVRQRPVLKPDPALWGFDHAGAAPFVPTRTRADAHGAFAIDVLPGVALDLAVHDRGTTFWLAQRSVSADLGAHVLPPARSLALTLGAANGPVHGAAIDLSRPDARRTIGPDGVIQLSSRGTGPLLVVADRHVPIVLAMPEQRAVTLGMKPGKRLRARLRRVDGTPLAQTRCIFARPFRTDHGVEANPQAWLEHTGPDGALDVSWLEPQVPVLGCVELDHRFVCFVLRRPAGDLDLGDVVVSDRHALRGRVSGPDRTPAAGAWVFVRPALPSHEADLEQDLLSLQLSRAVVADRAGRFEVDGLMPGDYELIVRAPGSQLARRRAVPTVDPDPLSIALAPAHAIRGVVVDGAGQPVAGAVVRVRQDPNQPGAQRRRGTDPFELNLHCGPDGRFVCDDLPDATQIVLRAYGQVGGAVLHSATIEAPAHAGVITLRLEAR